MKPSFLQPTGPDWLRAGRPAVKQIRLVHNRRLVAKRFMDVALCLAMLPVALPVMAVCALLIWVEDQGPAIFRQMRTGKGGVRFSMYKFRTMVTNAEELKEKLGHLSTLS